MITIDMIHEAYREYGEKFDKAEAFYKNNGVCKRYYELMNEADASFDNYRELQEIYNHGGFDD